MGTQQYTQDGLTVPYIAWWTGEREARPRLLIRRHRRLSRIGYADESLHDLDGWDALWVRHSLGRGVGRARFDWVHAMRQRQTMLHGYCQICRGPATDPRTGRQLYVVRGDKPIEEGRVTSAPPVCTGCAPDAVRSCPRLSPGYQAAYVEAAPAWGVFGIRYVPNTIKPRPQDKGRLVAVEYGDPDLRWTIAYRQCVRLHGITPVPDVLTLAA
ncbi:hypothetical protein SAMN05428942_7279 [Streptomyces sp. 2112.2]|uniref:hypothetical protein n=1 Tax=Streptomyces sp. 2112.2 TaxID=1881024 RepID=UPI00089D13C3|nr:hypothetical protein [Streptomyces sp. 2112.2]SEF16455.1 hypothetical protein SAMN05428942_7279 [Streptomyces sp. 2112.2]